MNKRKSLLIILLLIVLILGVLNYMWIQDLKDLNRGETYKETVPKLGMQSANVVYMTVHQDRLYPYTIEANKGDMLVIDFADVNATEIEIPGYDFSQKVRLYSFNLILDKAGVFEYYCLNCEQKAPGLLIVN